MIPFDKDELHHTTANKKREKSIPTPFTKRRKKKKKHRAEGRGRKNNVNVQKLYDIIEELKSFPQKKQNALPLI